MAKAIIKGKMYNTETANFIGDHESPYNPYDFNYYEESLYRKKTGEFFISGKGGPCTKYAHKYVDGYGSGESIIPLTEDAAKEWVETYLDADKYIEIFGEVDE